MTPKPRFGGCLPVCRRYPDFWRSADRAVADAFQKPPDQNPGRRYAEAALDFDGQGAGKEDGEKDNVDHGDEFDGLALDLLLVVIALQRVPKTVHQQRIVARRARAVVWPVQRSALAAHLLARLKRCSVAGRTEAAVLGGLHLDQAQFVFQARAAQCRAARGLPVFGGFGLKFERGLVGGDGVVNLAGRAQRITKRLVRARRFGHSGNERALLSDFFVCARVGFAVRAQLLKVRPGEPQADERKQKQTDHVQKTVRGRERLRPVVCGNRGRGGTRASRGRLLSVMDDFSLLVGRAAAPNAPLAERHQAFHVLVTRFQDMAFAGAYAILGDAALAEDAAQEAFLVAWQRLPQLREPQAFPGWLRRIVRTQCGRVARRERQNTQVPLNEDLPSPLANDPHVLAEQSERAVLVRAAVAALPPTERLVVLLFYVGGYTRSEVAAFAGISSVAVKKRLASARGRLRERMLSEMKDELEQRRPSRDDAFAVRVLAFTKLFSAAINAGTSLVRSLTTLAEQETDPVFRTVIEQICREVEEGYTLSSAMARHPEFFRDDYVRAIRTGEVVGRLEVVLSRLAQGTYSDALIKPVSNHAGEAFVLAYQKAQERGHRSVRAEHLLLGILQVSECAAVRLMEHFGVDTIALHAQAEELVAAPAAARFEGLGPEEERAGEIADEEAARRGDPEVGTLHLLLGLLLVPGSNGAVRLLTNAGVSVERVRAALDAP